MRKFFIASTASVALIILWAGYQLWSNNRTVDAPSPMSISASLEKGIGWLVNNRSIIVNDQNAMLWSMVKESADITQDRRLQMLFSEYKLRQIDPYPGNVWRYLFDPHADIPIGVDQLIQLPDYNLYFIYGASCSTAIAQEDIIRRQHDPEFCSKYHPISPACVTHQLIGARLIQERHCLDERTISSLIRALQSKIITQLTWDPRVVDVYIQRVWTLAESGGLEQVKPVWMHRVLDAQSEDGGWTGFEPLLPVGRSYYIGFVNNGFAIQRPSSNFHATAQGVLLMSIFANSQQGHPTR